MNLVDHFLIAMPHVEDEFFKKSVVYIYEHDETDVRGLVLTNKTDLSVAELCAKVNHMVADRSHYPNGIVLAGGPVLTDRGFILHTVTPMTFQQSYQITDDVFLSTSPDALDALEFPIGPEKFLVALGCAKWTPKQLEQELARDWLVVQATETVLFDVPPEERYSEATQLLGIHSTHFIHQTVFC